MKFEIILHEDIGAKSIKWHVASEYSMCFMIPSDYIDNLEKKETKIDLLRREGAAVHAFLKSLNHAYHKTRKFKNINVYYSDKSTYKDPRVSDAFLEGFVLSNYEFTSHKTCVNNRAFTIDTGFNDEKHSDSVMGTCIARDLVNQPLSHLNAENFSQKVKALGKEAGFNVEVLNEKKIRDLKMGGVLSVNRGSITKPTFNILTYVSQKSKTKPPVILIGKGVMYDTGGLSLKPTQNSMDMMKCDMAGAAAVVGAIYALAKSRTNCNVVGLIPAVENRPGGDAYVPGDVITMMNGTTVEVLNTDAEGRLILADALCYAKKYKPAIAIDLATLTGSAARSVGKYGAVCMENYTKEVFSNFSDNMRILMELGNYTGERLVAQPFWDDYNKELESSVADIKNLGGAEAGHITAGKFLEKFVDYPWIHLDIAGVAFLQSDYLYHKKGGTGFGVRLLVKFLKRYFSHKV